MAHDSSIEIGNVHGVLVGSSARVAERVDHFSGLQDVQLVHIRSHVRLHVLNHSSDVGDVCLGVRQTSGQLGLQKASYNKIFATLNDITHLSGQRAREQSLSHLLLLHRHAQHDGGGQLVSSRCLVARLHSLNYMYGIPAATLDITITIHI